VRRRTLLILALAAALPLRAAEIELVRLFESLARRKPGRAEFHERKFLALLAKPVESRGELVFTPPGRLEKRTVTPRPESVVVDGGRITLERAGRTYTMGLGDNPGVAVLIESIRATLAGDLGALTRTYSAAVAGTEAKWKLTLRPLDPAVSTLVERIEIEGARDLVRAVEIFQNDGDRSLMTITPSPG